MKNFLNRIHIRLHALAAAFLAAVPILLDRLGVIDLHPILAHVGISPPVADLIIGLMPFYLAFIKPLVHVEPAEATP
jgi:hypothetical protein